MRRGVADAGRATAGRRRSRGVPAPQDACPVRTAAALAASARGGYARAQVSGPRRFGRGARAHGTMEVRIGRDGGGSPRAFGFRRGAGRARGAPLRARPRGLAGASRHITVLRQNVARCQYRLRAYDCSLRPARGHLRPPRARASAGRRMARGMAGSRRRNRPLRSCALGGGEAGRRGQRGGGRRPARRGGACAGRAACPNPGCFAIFRRALEPRGRVLRGRGAWTAGWRSVTNLD